MGTKNLILIPQADATHTMSSSCILCPASLPPTSKKRRLYGLPSSIVLQLLQTKANKLGVEEIIPPRPSSSQGSYLCLPCFHLIEKAAKARAHLQQLEEDLHKKMVARASTLNSQLLSQHEPSQGWYELLAIYIMLCLVYSYNYYNKMSRSS